MIYSDANNQLSEWAEAILITLFYDNWSEGERKKKKKTLHNISV